MLGATRPYDTPQPPTDSISDLSWLETTNNPHFLACSSWDKSVRVWQVNISGQIVEAVPKALYNHEAPALSCAVSKNGCIFSGGCDKVVRMHNLQTNQTTFVGQHEQPVCGVFVCEEKGLILSAGWDKTVKVWDTRSPTPGMIYNIGAKISAIDFKYPILAVAKADRNINLYNFETMSPNPAMNFPSNLRFQLRAISIFSDKKGYALGSIEGRCGVTFIEEASRSKSFPFKCHRIEDRTQGTKCYPVNSIDFSPYGTFATAGADGSIASWDKDNRQRLRSLEGLQSPVTKIKYDPTGSVMAYGLSYDWHKGHAFSDPAKYVNKVVLQVLTADMVKPKPPQQQQPQQNQRFGGRR